MNRSAASSATRPPRITRVSAAEILDLRHAVLRAGLPRESAVFPGDDDPRAAHFAAVLGDRVIGCATLHASELEGEPAWQLRGMAVHCDFQNQRIGSRMLAELERFTIEQSPARVLCCNARSSAIAFYLRHGWQVVSEEFVTHGLPHRKMIKRLGASVR